MTVSLEVLDERLGGISEQPPIVQVQDMVGALEAAPNTGLVSALPFAEPTMVAEAGSERSRVLTIRNRLYRLGYLETDSAAVVLDDSYKSAVRAFQKDARLTLDGWVGDQTWGALQELVSFEEPLDIERWYDHRTGRACPALRRAVQLRLFVLGLVKDDPRSGHLPLPAALKRFAEAGALLGLTASTELSGNETALLTLLFDLEAMTASLGGAVDFGEAFVARRGDVRGAWLNAALIMVNTAKIELWLAGYDVDLDDRKPIETTKLFGTGHRRRWQPNDSLGSALKRYWRNRSRSGEISASEASSRQARLGMLLLHEMPAFLRETAEASAEYHRIPDEVRSQSIADWYRMHPQHVETSVRRVDTLRSRLWDGIKRAWSWIKGLIRDAFDAARKFAQDIAAVAHAFATRTFGRVAGAVRAISETLSTVLSRTLPGSATDHIVIARERDFDYRLFVNTTGTGQTIRSTADTLAASAARFKSGCETVGLLVHFVIRAISLIGTGGAGLFFSLIDIFGTLAAIRRRFQSA